MSLVASIRRIVLPLNLFGLDATNGKNCSKPSAIKLKTLGYKIKKPTCPNISRFSGKTHFSSAREYENFACFVSPLLNGISGNSCGYMRALLSTNSSSNSAGNSSVCLHLFIRHMFTLAISSAVVFWKFERKSLSVNFASQADTNFKASSKFTALNAELGPLLRYLTN